MLNIHVKDCIEIMALKRRITYLYFKIAYIVSMPAWLTLVELTVIYKFQGRLH